MYLIQARETPLLDRSQEQELGLIIQKAGEKICTLLKKYFGSFEGVKDSNFPPRVNHNEAEWTHDVIRYLERCIRQSDARVKLAEALRINPKELARVLIEIRRPYRRWLSARDQFARANLRLVVNIAAKYRGLGLPMLDLIQAGNLGLLRGIDMFDPRKGNRFSTYGFWWICRAMERALADHQDTIRIPVHVSDLAQKINWVEKRLLSILEVSPDPKDVADMAGVPVRDVDLVHKRKHTLSLDHMVSGSDSPLGYSIGEEDPVLERTVAEGWMKAAVEEALKSLTSREQRVLSMCFGLSGEEEHTLEEIGKTLGNRRITRERVRQIRKAALGKLRKRHTPRTNGSKTTSRIWQIWKEMAG